MWCVWLSNCGKHLNHWPGGQSEAHEEEDSAQTIGSGLGLI
jgi:hypothetical protein